MNNSFLSTNATTYLQYFHFHDQLYDNIPAKIIYVFLLFTIHIVGPILLSGIIIFERKGGDPQKRNVINRLFSKSLTNLIIFNIVIGGSKICREVFGLLNFNIMILIEYIGYISASNIILYSNEMTIIKYLHIIVWKRVKGINDEFWAFFLSAVTLSWSTWQCIQEHIPNEMSMYLFKISSANFPGPIAEER